MRGASSLLLLAFFLNAGTVHAGILTPFRIGFGDFHGGRVTPVSPDTKISELDFIDLGRDLPIDSKKSPNQKTEFFIQVKARYARAQWALTLNGEPLKSDSQDSTLSTGSIKLGAEGKARFSLAAVSARGEVEEAEYVFEPYDWDLFQKEWEQAPAVRGSLGLWGELALHSLSDTQNGVTTYTPVNLSFPQASVEWTRWNARHSESRAWRVTLSATTGFVLPLAGVLFGPPFELVASLQRQNLFWFRTPAKLPFHPGLRLRFEGIAQAAERLAAGAPSVVLLNFTPRYTLVSWVDLMTSFDLEWKGFRGEFLVFFSRSIAGTSFRSDGASAFFPSGWGGGFRAKVQLPAPRDRLFAVLDGRYEGLGGLGGALVTDFGVDLGFGILF